ncbi:hypothetical protein ACLMJK_007586 [Lecanora helva]
MEISSNMFKVSHTSNQRTEPLRSDRSSITRNNAERDRPFEHHDRPGKSSSSSARPSPVAPHQDVVAEKQALEETIHDLHGSNKQLVRENEKLKDSYNEVSHELGKMQLECSETRAKLDACQNDLAACTNEIFSLQPPDQVSDDVVREKWDVICERIDQWIDDDSGHLQNLNQMATRSYCKRLALIIDSLKNPEIQRHLETSCDNILDYILCHIIHELLSSGILAERVGLLGLHPNQLSLLKRMKENLGSLEPSRDPAFIALWESETVRALCGANSNFAQIRDAQVRSIHKYADGLLHDLLPNRTREAMKEFRREIVGRSIELASIIRCSSKEFYFDFNAKLGPIIQDDLKNAEFRDAASKKVLKPSGQNAMSQADVIGEGILVVQPALRRRRVDAADVVLRKPLILAVNIHR